MYIQYRKYVCVSFFLITAAIYADTAHARTYLTNRFATYIKKYIHVSKCASINHSFVLNASCLLVRI